MMGGRGQGFSEVKASVGEVSLRGHLFLKQALNSILYNLQYSPAVF